jgi:hypothetical protein
MPKTNVRTRFDSLVSEVIWPLFKTKGYRKTGKNFRFYDVGWGKIVNVQKSFFGDKSDISFTINTGLYLIKADTMFESAKQERFLEPDCLVRKRIGQLKLQGDTWYNLNAQTLPEQLENQVMHDFASFVLPYLERIQSEDDILKLIIRERSPKSAEAIRTLSLCGYATEANQWLEDEIANTIYSTGRQQLIQLRELFK